MINQKHKNVSCEYAELSYAQRRLWFLDRMDEQCGQYNELSIKNIDGKINVDIFKKSIEAIVNRHEILRTTFSDVDGRPLQKIHTSIPLPITVERPEYKDESALDAYVEKSIQDVEQKPFDLASGPVFSIKLIVKSESSYTLIMNMHHIICDAWSTQIFIRELQYFYSAYLEGKTSPLPVLPMQYADYAAWEQGEKQKADRQAGLEYWKRTLASAPALLELPLDNPRPRVQSYQGRELRFTIPHRLCQSMDELNRETRTSAFMSNLLLWSYLLSYLSRAKEVVIGVPVANRGNSKIQGLIGFFVNTLPFCLKMDATKSFKAQLSGVKKTVLEGMAHENTPFEKIVEQLKTDRDLSYSPVFQVLFSMQNSSNKEASFGDVRVTDLERENTTSKFDLSLILEKTAEGLNGCLSYNRGLFSAESAEAIVSRYLSLFAQSVQQPELALAQHDLLSAEEYRRVVCDWNNTQQTLPLDVLHSGLFEQAKRSPNRIALQFEGQQLSYSDTVTRVDTLAEFLANKGVGPETLVGVCVHRSIEMVLCLYAILRAGGAYVPFDPEQPDVRLDCLLRDAEVSLLLTHGLLSDRLSSLVAEHAGLELVDVEQNYSSIVQGAAAYRAAGRSLDEIDIGVNHLAYMMYTSGSTGMPKGVMNEHRGIANRIAWQHQCLPIFANDIVLQKTPYHFDVSIWELFVPLGVGAKLVIAPPGVHRESDRLSAMIESEQISVMHFVPSMLQAFLHFDGHRAYPSLRQVLCSGEALLAEQRDMFFRRFKHCTLHNLYGPTEAGIEVTHWQCQAEHKGQPIPLGYPTGNNKIYILDEHNKPVVPGTPGELHIGGVQLARGYWKGQALSAEKFIPDPFVNDIKKGLEAPSAKMYKSGDLARHRSDGAIEYLGRLDTQVKIRGVRIELGEIEAALLEFDAVNGCVVGTRQAHKDSQALVSAELVVWLSLRMPVHISDIKRDLKERLPDYMLPKYYVIVDEIPLNSSGKIDRKGLPEPELGAALDEAIDDDKPRTALEKNLHRIWCSVLELSELGCHQNFFSVGGHSLLAAQLRARIEMEIQLRVPIRAIFCHPCIAELARYINEDGDCLDKPSDRIQPIETDSCDEALGFPLSFAQERLWFIEQLQAHPGLYNISQNFYLSGVDNADNTASLLHKTLQRLVSCHSALHSVYRVAEKMYNYKTGKAEENITRQPCQVFLPAMKIDYDYQDLSHDQDDDACQRCVDEAVLAQQKTVFDLENGPLVRLKILRLRSQRFAVLLTLHHLVADAWSLGKLIRQFNTLFQMYQDAGEKNRQVDLPESLLEEVLPRPLLTYKDYAVWQWQQHAQGAFQASLDYWTCELADSPALLNLPVDRSRPPVQKFNGASQSFDIGPAVLAKLSALSASSPSVAHENAQGSSSLFMLLFAVFNAWLSRYSRQTDIVVGIPVANRQQSALEDMMGMFVNSVAVRTDLSGNPDFMTLLAAVRDKVIAAIEHSDVPFEKVVEACCVEHNPAVSPFFQVMFVLQNSHRESLCLEGLHYESLAVNSLAAKFDLTCILEENRVDGEVTGLRGLFEYNTDLFDRESIVAMVATFKRLLESIGDAPLRAVAEHSLIAPQEQQYLIDIAAGPVLRYPCNTAGQVQGIATRFGQIAARFPDKLALSAIEKNGQTGELTYAELDEKSDMLAHWLMMSGVAAGEFVGVLLPRSTNRIVVLLALVKTAAVYVPMEETWPSARIELLAKDARIKRIVSDKSLPLFADTEKSELENTLDVTDLQVLEIHWPSIREQLGTRIKGALPFTDGADIPTYLMYTSGTTGDPKGVVIRQKSILRLVSNSELFQFSHNDVYLQHSPIAFDASTFEVWAPLLNGGHLHIARPGLIPLDEMANIIVQAQVSILWVTTGLFSAMVQDQLASLVGIKTIYTGGEIMPPEIIHKAATGLANTTLYNCYGPTENTTFSSAYKVQGTLEALSPVPLGLPLPNSSLYVMDDNAKLMPVGVPGELYVGGDGLAEGYFNHPSLSAEKFVSHPYAAGEKLYRTGDLVVRRPQGVLAFIGRMDKQIKIRGFRIEPGEIEFHLNRLPMVAEGLVDVVDFPGSGKQIVAWVLASADHPELQTRISQALKQHLPSYMIPAHIVVLESFPLSVNGKVQRRALPLPTTNIAVRTAPSSQQEKLVAAIWCDLLQREQICLEDNFFSLGGHSLLATQLVSRLRSQLNIEYPLSELFVHPTLGAQCDSLVGYRAGDGQAHTISALACRTEFSLSFAQERLWFLDQMEPGNPFYNVFVALDIGGELNVPSLYAAFSAIVSRYDSCRTRFMSRHGIPLAVIDDMASYCRQHSLMSEFQLDEKELDKFLADEARLPFNLQTGPLLRVKLLKLSEGRHVLTLCMHHIISDGWSIGVLVNALSNLYSRHLGGEKLDETALPLQYGDYAAWQRAYLAQGVLETQLAYWKAKLHNADTVLDFPTDYPRKAQQSYRGASHRFDIDVETTCQLKRISEQHGATLYMTLLCAWAIFLHRYSAKDDILIGSPIANRTQGETEDLIGFFVNTLTMRVEIDPNTSFGEALAQVRTTAMEAYQHQDLPFEKLVDEMQSQRDLSRNPLFQVMFALQNAPLEELTLPGAKLELRDTGRVAALFDLVLDMWDTEAGLVGVLEYSSDLFRDDTALRMTEHFTTLLSSIVRAQTDHNSALASRDSTQITKISDLSLQPIAEFEEIMRWQGARSDYPVTQTLQSLFAASVHANRDRIAAIHNQDHMSYAQLDQRSSDIARALANAGTKHKDLIAIYHPRGLDFLAAVLAIFKVGAAYVPIDPCYPKERVDYMLKDSACRVVLSDQGLVDTLCLPARQTVIALDKIASTYARKTKIKTKTKIKAQKNLPPKAATADDLAYVIYTSGSTGQPKGAMIRHSGAINHIYAEYEALDFNRDGVFLQTAPSSSDISVWQLIAPLLLGACTRIVDYEVLCDLECFWQELKQATLVELVPVVVSELLSYVAHLPKHQRGLDKLQYLMITGEALSASLVNRWLLFYPDIPVVNAYGPSEAADDVCQHIIREPISTSSEGIYVPIGKPLANTHLYVLDSQQRQLPVGVVGEICVSGICVGPGYWRNKEKTQASYLANPYAVDEHHQILYRTGDMGRWLADGTLEYRYRCDAQVQLRGFRIELGEIEAALLQHSGVTDAVVDMPAASESLCAWIVPNLNASESDGQGQARVIAEEQVELWQDLHDNSYQVHANPDNIALNTTGWDSTYTGEPLSMAEMEEYIHGTRDRVKQLCPNNILEIGCGTGLLLFAMLPHCKRYHGTDLSSVAIARLQAQWDSGEIQSKESFAGELCLHQCEATDFSRVAAGEMDTVMLCSVVQYFPSSDYLRQVIRGAIKNMPPTGSIFIGDVRHLALLEAFHASLVCFKSDPQASRLDCERALDRRLNQEQELALSPAYFIDLKAQLPAIAGIQILVKRGKLANELSCFRYDVILHIHHSEDCTVANKRFSDAVNTAWASKLSLDVAQLNPEILSTSPLVLVKGIINARVERALAQRDWLRQQPLFKDEQTLEAFNCAVESHTSQGLEPEDLYAMADRASCHLVLVQCPAQPAVMHAIFYHGLLWEEVIDGETQWEDRSLPTNRPYMEALLCELLFNETFEPGVEKDLSNNPLQERFFLNVVPDIRSQLERQLPAHMVPSSFQLLAKLPQLPNGKVDRGNLPQPECIPGIEKDIPTTQAQKTMALIWQQVLGIPEVGVQQNFFELGGHSLKATQVISRIEKEFKVTVPVREMFSKPTVGQLCALVETLQPSAIKNIVRVPEQEDYPASNAQKRLWILSRFEGANVAYNMPAAFEVSGDIQLSEISSRLHKLVEQHEILRTKLLMKNGELRQQVCSFAPINVFYSDISSVENKDAVLDDLLEQDIHAEFDLSAVPQFRVTLICLAPQRHVLLFNIHHIIADEWSLNLWAKVFSGEADMSTAEDPGATRPMRALQYRDYSAWQHQLLLSPRGGKALAYWETVLSAPIAALNLPMDGTRPALKTYRGDCYRIDLGRSLQAGLRRYSQQQSTSVFCILAAAVHVLLYRYTGQADINLGTPIAGRPHIELEDQFGFYTNTLVLRNQLIPTANFEQFLARVSEGFIAAIEHQMVPFDLLVEKYDSERDVSRSPLFDVMVVLQNIDKHALALGDDKPLKALALEDKVAKFDISFTFSELADGLVLDVVYNSDLFHRERIQRTAKHFARLLTALLEQPQQALSQMTLLGAKEQQHLLSLSGAMDVDVRALATEETMFGDRVTSVLDLFEQHARDTPDNTALVFYDESLTYRQLNQQANALASRILLYHLAHEEKPYIAIVLAPSLQLVVSVLAVLKAGYAYVPVDPAYPNERISALLDDCQCTIVITEKEDRDWLFDGLTLYVGSGVEADYLSTQEVDRPSRNSPAYLMYTSGSTGKPKACRLKHGNLLSLMTTNAQAFHFTRDDVWLMAHAFCFDFSVWEIFGALTTGGQLVLACREDVRNARQLHSLVQRHKVTVLNQTPAAFENFVAIESQQHSHCLDKHLRLVIFGGDRLESRYLKQWAQWYHLDKVNLVNMYGITETCVHVTRCTLSEKDLLSDARVSVGVPLPGAKVYICDRDMNLQPIGIPGEIYVGGSGVCDGYWQREALTRKRFIRDPFTCGDRGSTRLYASGDLGVWGSDGRIYHLGRNDDQVQIRGFRIELGEIESRIASWRQDIQCAVVADQNSEGSAVINAYIAGAEIHEIEDELADFLSSQLPHYMLPTRYISVDKVKLNSNGKIDKKMLCDPSNHLVTRKKYHTTAASETFDHDSLIDRLRALWQEVLQIDAVGDDDNFFDVGGHSLHIIQLASLLKSKLNTVLTEVDLFRFTTLRAQAAYIVKSRANDVSTAVDGRPTIAENNSEAAALQARRQHKKTLMKD